MSPGALFAVGFWGALTALVAYSFSHDLRQWWTRQCRYEQLRQDFGMAALAPGLRMSDVIDAEAPTEDIEEALIIANGWGPAFEEILALPEVAR